MSTPYISEIKIMSFGFAPKGWAQCNGQLLPIIQNQALFALIGTTYGGDGVNTFALPNLQARIPMHFGNGHTIGESGGEQAHTLSLSEMPIHTHTAYGTPTDADSPIPVGNFLGEVDNAYASPPSTTLQTATIGTAGGSQPHSNLQPYLALNFCIALQGIFPTPS